MHLYSDISVVVYAVPLLLAAQPDSDEVSSNGGSILDGGGF